MEQAHSASIFCGPQSKVDFGPDFLDFMELLANIWPRNFVRTLEL